MGLKAEARALRKQEKIARFEASKPSLLERVQLDAYPKAAIELDANAAPRVAPKLDHRGFDQGPIAIESGSRHRCKMTWCVERSDCDGYWSWREPRAWSEAEWNSEIQPKLGAFTKHTWAELEQHVFGRRERHRMHHSHEIGDLVDEAQDRWRTLELEQFDTVWRFRLGSTKRAWGFIVQAHFHMVWWERNHQIYPV